MEQSKLIEHIFTATTPPWWSFSAHFQGFEATHVEDSLGKLAHTEHPLDPPAQALQKNYGDLVNYN